MRETRVNSKLRHSHSRLAQFPVTYQPYLLLVEMAKFSLKSNFLSSISIYYYYFYYTIHFVKNLKKLSSLFFIVILQLILILKWIYNFFFIFSNWKALWKKNELICIFSIPLILWSLFLFIFFVFSQQIVTAIDRNTLMLF